MTQVPIIHQNTSFLLKQQISKTTWFLGFVMSVSAARRALPEMSNEDILFVFPPMIAATDDKPLLLIVDGLMNERTRDLRDSSLADNTA